MYIAKFSDFDLLMSYDPCEIFEYFDVEELHGLNFEECKEYDNTDEDAYIAGWCNISPDDEKPFVFVNITRCTNTMRTTGLIMHELSHLYWMLNSDNLEEMEEEIITNSEERTYEIMKLINQVKKTNKS